MRTISSANLGAVQPQLVALLAVALVEKDGAADRTDVQTQVVHLQTVSMSEREDLAVRTKETRLRVLS